MISPLCGGAHNAACDRHAAGEERGVACEKASGRNALPHCRRVQAAPTFGPVKAGSRV